MYDPSIIQQFAQALYAEADSIVLWSTFQGGGVGAGIGFAMGFGAGMAMGGRDLIVTALLAMVGIGLLGAWYGFSAGRRRAFMLRLEAQRALVLVQIEMNTRAQPVQGYAQPQQGYGAPSTHGYGQR